MKPAIKGMLLSGLVFPGLGQIALGKIRRGVAFLLVALACVVVIVREVTETINTGLQDLDPTVATGADALRQLADQAAQTSAGGWSDLVVVVLAICWIWSAVDAFLTGRRMDRQQGTNAT